MHVAVAVSGGRDSTALLHCVARAALSLGVQVHALHVHHGLMADADRWVGHLQAQVDRWSRRGWPVDLRVHRLTDKPRPGDSVEAWARKRRYAALAQMAQAAGASIVLLAHHRQDQAETVLLQALRGAGAAGLSAMPRSAQRGGILWIRPWLDHSRVTVDAYLRRYRLRFVDDQSNHDARYARSRLRHDVWPALVAAFPDADISLSLAARRAQENAACLHELAVIDLTGCADEQTLRIDAWRTLSAARRRLALRVWLTRLAVGPVPETLVQRLALELGTARSGSWPWHDGGLRLYRGNLRRATRAAPVAAAALPVAVDLREPDSYQIDGWQGMLIVEATSGPGISAADLATAECRSRHGGERFLAHAGGTPRSLKKQFQAAGVPSWSRDGPVVYVQGRLAFVPGLGMDARACTAPPGEGYVLCWQPEYRPQ